MSLSDHQASILAGALSGHTEVVRFQMPGLVQRMGAAAERMEAAAQEMARQNDRLEELLRQRDDGRTDR